MSVDLARLIEAVGVCCGLVPVQDTYEVVAV